MPSPSPDSSGLHGLLADQERPLLDEWVRLQLESLSRRADLIDPQELRQQAAGFLSSFREALGRDPSANPRSGEWNEVRRHIEQLSRDRARQGFTAAETATFVMSLKQPLFSALRNRSKDAAALGDAVWTTTGLLDSLALTTVDAYIRSREEVIQRQQEELLELSTPVVRLWDRVLALPLIGTLDSSRTQVVMESLLQEIVRSSASIAIIDITGVPTVDTLVAQHLLKTVAAARLMGADCIISGIRPQIAQTIVHLGVQLGDVTTKGTLADAFSVALKRLGKTVTDVAR